MNDKIPEDLENMYHSGGHCTEHEKQALIERIARLEAENERLSNFRDEAEAVLNGELGSDWADQFGPLYELLIASRKAEGAKP